MKLHIEDILQMSIDRDKLGRPFLNVDQCDNWDGESEIDGVIEIIDDSGVLLSGTCGRWGIGAELSCAIDNPQFNQKDK